MRISLFNKTSRIQVTKSKEKNTLNFLNNIIIFFHFKPSNRSDLGGRQWECRIGIDANDRDGVLSFSAAGVGWSISSTAVSPQITVDKTPPVASTVGLFSNGAVPSVARTGNTVTLVVATTEPIAEFTGTILGIDASRVAWASTANTRVGTYTVLASDARTVLSVSLSLTDGAGNTGVITATTSAPLLIVSDTDFSTPPLKSVAVRSSNPSPKVGRAGDVITLAIVGAQNINRPTVTVYTAQTPALASVTGSGDTWSATYTVGSSDRQGPFSFVVDYTDLGGVPGPKANAATDGSVVVVDTVAPGVSASMFSNNTLLPKAAALGDLVTLRVTLTEPATVTVRFDGLKGPVTLTGNPQDSLTWFATVTAAAGDTEGTVGYSIAAVDAAGNEGGRIGGTGVIRAVCGSRVTVLGEECDGDYRCNPTTCKCLAPRYPAPVTGLTGCYAGAMVALAERPSLADPAVKVYSLQLWGNAHSPPATLRGITDWLQDPTNLASGAVKLGALTLAVSPGWGLCRVAPSPAPAVVNVSYVSESDTVEAAPTRLISVYFSSLEQDARAVWNSLTTQARGYPWAEDVGFPASGQLANSTTVSQARRFPNSIASATSPQADLNAFPRYLLSRVGIAWPDYALAPLGDTAHPVRVTPRNRIDLYCKAQPLPASVTPSAADCLARQLNITEAGANQQCVSGVVPLSRLIVRQTVPRLTETAVIFNLATLLSIDRLRVSIYNMQPITYSSSFPLLPGRVTAATSRRHSLQVSSASANVTYPAVLIEFKLLASQGDPLGLLALDKLADYIDSADQTPLSQVRLSVLDYNVEDLALRPPGVDVPAASLTPAGLGSGKYRYAWVAIPVIGAILAAVVAGYFIVKNHRMSLKEKEIKQMEEIKAAQSSEHVLSHQGTTTEVERGDALPDIKAGLGTYRAGSRATGANSKFKMATLPVLALSGKVRKQVAAEEQAMAATASTMGPGSTMGAAGGGTRTMTMASVAGNTKQAFNSSSQITTQNGRGEVDPDEDLNEDEFEFASTKR
jgi:hypothetical protein